MINFIVQTNLIKNEDIEDLFTALDKEKATYYPVKVIPFMDDYVEGEPSPGYFDRIPVCPLGSTTLMRTAMNRRWKPAMWQTSEFYYDKYIEHYGDEMLNADAKYYRLMDVPKFTGLKFIRPVKDMKAFAGVSMDGANFDTWRDTMLELEVTAFPETPVLVADSKDIQIEYRFFVVNGKVITGSMYTYDRKFITRPLEYEYSLDMDVLDYAQKQVDRWQPAEAFVIDIAVLDADKGIYKIIEINGLNASGFYDSDKRAVIRAIMDLYEPNERNIRKRSTSTISVANTSTDTSS